MSWRTVYDFRKGDKFFARMYGYAYVCPDCGQRRGWWTQQRAVDARLEQIYARSLPQVATIEEYEPGDDDTCAERH